MYRQLELPQAPTESPDTDDMKLRAALEAAGQDVDREIGWVRERFGQWGWDISRMGEGDLQQAVSTMITMQKAHSEDPYGEDD